MALRSDHPTAVARPPRRRLANAIRMLSMDAVEAAKSGHPGMPMGMADIAEVLWNDYLRFNPANGHWHDRDRFVLSNGHGSMLLYSIAYLTGYDIELDELKNFRQLGSRVAGHPERELDDRHRDDDGAARAGPRERRRHGARGEASRGRVQSARLPRRRSLHLRVPRRRLPDGRHLARGVLVRRHAQARQADRLLRRQRHLDRRRNARLVHGRHAEAFRRVRLARRAERRRPRSGRGPARDRCGARRQGTPVADLLQDDHRLRRAERAGHVGHARRGARSGRGRGGAQEPRLGRAAVRRPGRREGRRGTRASAARGSRPIGRSGSRLTASNTPSSRPSSSGA